MSDAAQSKRTAAEAAVAEIETDMLVGLGTGTTAAFAIDALAHRMNKEGLRVIAAATSLATARAAEAAGIRIIDFADKAALDLAIDGADEIDPLFRAIKGAGGALMREKIIASSAARMICIVDDSKPVATLGARPLPIEVLPFARSFVSARIRLLGGDPQLRVGADGQPALSDQGNLLIDCKFGSIADASALAEQMSDIPGLLEHGLFLTEIDAVMIGGVNAVERRERVTIST